MKKLLIPTALLAMLMTTTQAHALYFAWHEDNNDGHVDPRPDDDDDDDSTDTSSDPVQVEPRDLSSLDPNGSSVWDMLNSLLKLN